MLRAQKTRIRNANPGSSIARAVSQHDGATRNLAGNPDSPQAVIFLASITDVMMGS